MSGLPTPYQEFIHLSRYSRWLENKGRRETWEETVARYFDFFAEHLKEHQDYDFDPKDRKKLETAVTNLKVMPSMRALMTAGEALKRDNIAGYNCAFVTGNRVRSLDEVLYVLMCGTGMGFSVERQFVQKLPTISEEFDKTDTTIVAADSKQGWAKGYKELVSLLITGAIPNWDLSKIRPAGERLKTFGGRASGPEPLDDLMHFTVDIFRNAAGRKLTSYEVHRLFCKIAEVVVVGGVRRSALISLSNLTDQRMATAKSGQWWVDTPEMALANNSVAYTEKPDMGIFMSEWNHLYESKSGERGIFNREAAVNAVKKLGEDRRDSNHEFGCNPCSEILLRDREFCNLSEVVVRAEDTLKTLKEKVKLATILGTFQASLTNFKYVSKQWSDNCKEEALLGVSLTGIMDNEYMNGSKDYFESGTGNKPMKLSEILEQLKQVAIKTNKEWAKKIGINQAAAITCVKPSGTVSQLVDAASGIHARHSEYYTRTVRADKKDPLAQFMVDKGFPVEDDVMKPDHTHVFSFPVESPKGAVMRTDRTAIEQLDLWLTYQRHWCEHKPSVTISVKEDEWMDVGAWVYRYFDEVSGVSFLPFSEHSYRQAPYQDTDEAGHHKLLREMPTDINWKELGTYEAEDNTSGAQTMACSGNACEIVDITSDS